MGFARSHLGLVGQAWRGFSDNSRTEANSLPLHALEAGGNGTLKSGGECGHLAYPPTSRRPELLSCVQRCQLRSKADGRDAASWAHSASRTPVSIARINDIVQTGPDILAGTRVPVQSLFDCLEGRRDSRLACSPVSSRETQPGDRGARPRARRCQRVRVRLDEHLPVALPRPSQAIQRTGSGPLKSSAGDSP
jgi:hypothetical protein